MVVFYENQRVTQISGAMFRTATYRGQRFAPITNIDPSANYRRRAGVFFI